MMGPNKVWALAVGLALACVACGGKESAAGASGGPVSNEVSNMEELDPAENLGHKIGSSYVETLRQVVAMLNARPAAEDARAMLEDLKSWTIELMVDLGTEREALPPEDRAKVDGVIRNRIVTVPAELYREYQVGRAHYAKEPVLSKLLADFNIITQYANFDLLKTQAPEEAKRLGIE